MPPSKGESIPLSPTFVIGDPSSRPTRHPQQSSSGIHLYSAFVMPGIPDQMRGDPLSGGHKHEPFESATRAARMAGVSHERTGEYIRATQCGVVDCHHTLDSSGSGSDRRMAPGPQTGGCGCDGAVLSGMGSQAIEERAAVPYPLRTAARHQGAPLLRA